MGPPMMCRRRILQMAALGLASARCGPNAVQPPAIGNVLAGNASALLVGSLRAVGTEPLAIGRDAGGVYAVTLVCTHAGCLAGVDAEEIICPCHGSRFDANGAVLRGPASAALDHFAVSADPSGNLTIETGTVVDASTRLKV